MSRELYLLRHAKADRLPDSSDFERPLKKRGKQNAKQVGAWLKQSQLIPDIILSSPAKRAISTARRVRSQLNHDIPIQQDMRLYASSEDCLRTVLSRCPHQQQSVLLVGHNPELEELLAYLVDRKNLPNIRKLMPTAALIRLKMPDDWSILLPGCAELVSITYARFLASA